MLEQKLREYLWKHSIEHLYHKTWISPTVFYKILKREWKKYNKNTLDILYDFFNLPIDSFYKENLKKWYSKTPSLFWTFVRYKRLKYQISVDELAKKIKMEKRALLRLESWDALPWYNSHSIQNIFEILNFTKEEREETDKYISNMKWIERRIKELEKDIE